MIERDPLAWWLLPAVAVTSPVFAVDYLTTEEAQRILFPDAERFVDRRVTLTGDQKAEIKKISGMRQRWDEQEVWRAERDGKLIGWFIVDNVIGKHEFITYGAAISPEGSVLGIEILSYRETHGGAVRDAEWRDRFKGKTLADPFKLDQDIPNLSGATLSSRNVTDGVKRLLALQQVALPRE